MGFNPQIIHFRKMWKMWRIHLKAKASLNYMGGLPKIGIYFFTPNPFGFPSLFSPSILGVPLFLEGHPYTPWKTNIDTHLDGLENAGG